MPEWFIWWLHFLCIVWRSEKYYIITQLRIAQFSQFAWAACDQMTATIWIITSEQNAWIEVLIDDSTELLCANNFRNKKITNSFVAAFGW